MKTVAVMKIGSTSTTLLVAADLGHVLVRQQSIVNLYAAQGPALLNAVLEDYTARADAAGCSIRLAAGGEGLRHHQELAGRIKDYHWPYWSVSGQLEGQLTWFAVKASHPDMEWLWDIGGGSTEVCSSQESYSIPVGAAHYGVANWPKDLSPGSPVVVGGTAHALHKVLQGKRMTRQAAECVRNQLAREPHTLDFLDETRRRIFPDGLKILQDLMEFYHCAEVSFSSRGFLEGLWLAASLGQDGAL